MKFRSFRIRRKPLYLMKDMHNSVIALVLIIVVASTTDCSSSSEGNNKNVTNSSSAERSSPTPQSAVGTVSGTSNILFIIDSSGSMKAGTGGKTKMETAKEVVNGLIAGLPARTNVGLLAYGHRTKDDCKDVELIVPIGPVQASTFTQKVNALQPIGQTPISFSIRQAAAQFQGVSGEKTIVLISDGEETCKEDPCGVAADLKKAAVELKIHVVGFGIDNDTARKQLNCIAEATGGVYRDAADAAGLKHTLEDIAKAPELPLSDTGRLVIQSMDSNGKRIFWCVQVYPAGRESVTDREFERCNESRAAENAFEVKPGPHEIYFYGASVGAIPGKRSVDIQIGKESRIELDQTGRLLLNIADQTGKPVECLAQLWPRDEKVKRGGPFGCGNALEVIPGEYDIEIWGAPVAVPKRSGVVIKSGEENRIDISITR